MQASDNIRTISRFLLRHIRKDDIGANEDLFASGYVNSLFALELVAFVEETFEITIEDGDLDLDNFRSLAAIDRLIQRKRHIQRG